MKKKVLFISHDGRRSGGPMLLLNFLKWLSEKNIYEITILLNYSGELEEEFGKLGHLMIYNKNISAISWRVKRFLENRHRGNVINNLNKIPWEFVFSNTITNGAILEKLSLKNSPVYSYIHEMSFSYNYYEKTGSIQGTIDRTTFYFCGSSIVKDNLKERYNIPEKKTLVVHSFIEQPDNNKKIKDYRINLCKELDIPEDAFVVGMMGALDWRKGGDFFLNTANLLKQENIYFVWVGVRQNAYFEELMYDATLMDCIKKMRLLPASLDHKKYFHLFDAFFLSSREDPYPIVMTEASSFGIPIICFENTGGSNEFLDQESGFIIPYGDISKVSERILELKNNHSLYHKMAGNIQKKSIAIHDININASLILNKILNNHE